MRSVVFLGWVLGLAIHCEHYRVAHENKLVHDDHHSTASERAEMRDKLSV